MVTAIVRMGEETDVDRVLVALPDIAQDTGQAMGLMTRVLRSARAGG